MNMFAAQYDWLERRHAEHLRDLEQIAATCQFAADLDARDFARLMNQAAASFRELTRIVALMDWCDPHATRSRPRSAGNLQQWVLGVIARCDKASIAVTCYALEMPHAA